MSDDTKLPVRQGYRALDVARVVAYLEGLPLLAERLGGNSAGWQAREVGDGNLNLVFIVEGSSGALCLKQALPYVRLVGESWPLPLDRAHYEHLALVEQSQWSAERVPAIYHHDSPMALTVMEYLSPHIILRKGLVQGKKYPLMAAHLGSFLAQTLYHTSDLHLPAVEKKALIGQYLSNTAMCQITEDLIFDEPYFAAELNQHTSPQLDDLAWAFRADEALKSAAQRLKWAFLNRAEALLHGDLHTGSVMVTEADTRVIDPEFAFVGPMGFDVGQVVANLLMAYFAQRAYPSRQAYGEWILAQILILHHQFAVEFEALSSQRNPSQPGGDVFHPRMIRDAPGLQERGVRQVLDQVWADTLGFAGSEMIRRVLGLAHVEDFEHITDPDVRAGCEKLALLMGREMMINPEKFPTISAVVAFAKAC